MKADKLISGVDCGEQCDPNKINKVPIPCAHFKPGAFFATKLMLYSTIQVVYKKTCSNKNMHSVKTSGHEKD